MPGTQDGFERASQRRKLTHGYSSEAAAGAANGGDRSSSANVGGTMTLAEKEHAAIIAELEKVRMAMMAQEAASREHEVSSSLDHSAPPVQGSRLRAELKQLQSIDSSPSKTMGDKSTANAARTNYLTWSPQATKEFVAALANDVILSQVAQHGFVPGSLSEQLRRGVATRRDAMVRNLWPDKQLSRSAISNKLNRLAEAYSTVRDSLSSEGAVRPTKEWKTGSTDWDKIAANDNQCTKHWWATWHDRVVLQNCAVTEIVEDGVRYASRVKLITSPPPPRPPPRVIPSVSPIAANGVEKTQSERVRQRIQQEEYDAARAARRKEAEDLEAEQQRYEAAEEMQGVSGTDQLFQNQRWPLDRSVALVRNLAKDPILSQIVMRKHLAVNAPVLEMQPGDTLSARRQRLCVATWPERKLTENAMKRKLESMRLAYESVLKALSKHGAEKPTREWPAESKDWDALQVEDGQWTSLWWCQWHDEVFLNNSRVTEVRADGTIIYSRPSSPAPVAVATRPRRSAAAAAPSDSSGPGIPLANEHSTGKSVLKTGFAASATRKLEEMDKRLDALEGKVDRILSLLEAQQGRSRRA